jgi:hypothetical protein
MEIRRVLLRRLRLPRLGDVPRSSSGHCYATRYIYTHGAELELELSVHNTIMQNQQQGNARL